MHENRLVAGLDIGTTKVSCLIGTLNEYDHLEVLGYGSAPNEGVVRGLVTNIDKTADAIMEAVRQAESKSGVDVKVVNVNLSGQFIRSSEQRGNLTRPRREEEIGVDEVARLTNDMHRTVIPHGNRIIHVLAKNYVVDYEEGIKDPVGMTGARLEADYHIVYSHVNAVNHIERALKKAGLEMDEIVFSPLSSAMACLSEEEKEMGVALVDIGGGTTDISVFFDSVVRHTAVIPYGGNIVTSDIKTGCAVMGSQAEALKTRFGSAIAELTNLTDIISISGVRNRQPKELSVRNLSHIIEARMQEIIELVHGELIASGFDDKLGAGIVITGGGAELKNLVQLFEFMTGQECRLGHPNDHLAKTAFEAVKLPTSSTVVGLVLTGFRKLDQREQRYAELGLPNRQRQDNHRETALPNGQKGNFLSSTLGKVKIFLTNDLDNNPNGF